MRNDKNTNVEQPPASAWGEVRQLAALFPSRRWVAPTMIALGLGAAFADTLSVGLAVMLLFALLGQGEQIAQGGGLLGRIYETLQSITGSDPITIASLFFVLILGSAALVYAYQVVTATMMNTVAQRVREAVHRQYVTVSYKTLQQREQGHLLHILATETWTVADAFYHVARIGVNVCAIIVFGTGLFLLSWVIGLTALLGAGILFVLLRMLSRPIRRLGGETLAANQVLAERMLVSLYGMRTLRVFAQEDYMLRVFSAASSKVRRLAIKTETIKAMIGPFGEVGSLGVLILIALVAGRAGVDVPTTIAGVLLLFRLQPHIREIDASRIALAGLAASLGSVRELLADGLPHPREGARTFPGFKEELRFENVRFVHGERARNVLDDASFVIRRGEITMLAGPSGSGKTTILNLILRLYDPDGGRILADGEELHSYTRESWLARIAIAGQDIELVEGTLAQNLRIGARDADIEALRRACATAEILDDIELLPNGFDTRIGNAGQSFSGGQRQRIGIARAILRDPEFLILDEAMSAMEPALEARISARIAEMMRGRTILVVSHRADPAFKADHMIRVEAGRVIATRT